MITVLPALLGLLFSFVAEHSFAQGGGAGFIQSVIGAVGVGLPTNGAGGSVGFVGIAQLIVTRLRPLILMVAAVIMTITGFRMVIGQDDDALSKSRVIMTACITGVILSFLTERFVQAFYGATGEAITGGGTQIVNTEVGGIINWALAIVAVLAVTMIVISAFKAVLTPLSEEGINNMRQTVISVITGIIILVARVVLTVTFGGTGTPTPLPILTFIVHVLTYILGFAALAAVTVIIYAGILMVLNFGRDEEISKARGIITRAIIGLIIILISFGLVQFVLGVVA